MHPPSHLPVDAPGEQGISFGHAAVMLGLMAANSFAQELCLAIQAGAAGVSLEQALPELAGGSPCTSCGRPVQVGQTPQTANSPRGVHVGRWACLEDP
jgi:hypothetical protein